MNPQHTETLQKMMSEMECDHHFICVQSDFAELCRAEDLGVEGFVNCLDEHSIKCKHSLPFGNDYLCKCRVRVFLAKELGYCEAIGYKSVQR